MNDLSPQILKNWQFDNPNYSSYTIALSGGVDSVSLLYALVVLRKEHGFTLKAHHINHGISKNSDHWQQFCVDLCKKLDVPLEVTQYKIIKEGGQSLENQARELRYDALLGDASQVIVFAHHLNDQAETVLSQVLRGSNPHNVAAMKEISQVDDKTLWRPLLTTTKAAIQEYAASHELEYITDESNSDTKFLRNFIRHDILPKLVSWDKNVESKIVNFATQLQNDMAVLDEIATHDLDRCGNSSSGNIMVNVDIFKLLSPNRQTNLLSLFLRLKKLPLPSARQISEFARQAVTSSWDSKPSLKVDSSHNLVKSKNQIFIE